jgi:hypothetical protein
VDRGKTLHRDGVLAGEVQLFIAISQKILAQTIGGYIEVRAPANLDGNLSDADNGKYDLASGIGNEFGNFSRKSW